MRVVPVAVILLCASASCAFAQCPAQGEFDVAHASAQSIASRVVDSGIAEKLARSARSFHGFADLQKFADDNDWKIPERFVVCKVPSGRLGSVGKEQRVNVNSAGTGDLAQLKYCGVSAEEITALEKQNRSKTSFRDGGALTLFLAKYPASTSSACRSLKFVFSGGS